MSINRSNTLDSVYSAANRTDIVSNDIPVPLLGVEANGESSNLSGCLGSSRGSKDGREANKGRNDVADFGENLGVGVLAERSVHFEETVSGHSTGVDYSLGNSLVIAVKVTMNQERSQGKLGVV